MKQIGISPRWLSYTGSVDEALRVVKDLYAQRSDAKLSVNPCGVMLFEGRTYIFGPEFNPEYLDSLRAIPEVRELPVRGELASLYRDGAFFSNAGESLNISGDDAYPCYWITGRNGVGLGVENAVIVKRFKPLTEDARKDLLIHQVFRQDGKEVPNQLVEYRDGRAFSEKRFPEGVQTHSSDEIRNLFTPQPSTKSSGPAVLQPRPCRPRTLA